MSRFLKEELTSLEPYTPGEQPKIKDLIKLNTNENPYPPSPRVKQVLDELKKDDYRLYPDPEAADAVKACAEHFGLEEDQVILGNGSDEILAFAFMAYGKKVYFPETSYGFYPVFADIFGCGAVPVEMKELLIDPEDYMKNDGMVVIANPNAPTGVDLGLDAIEDILSANPDQVVLIDEAYVDFGAESCVSLIPKYDNLLVVQTFSKSRSLAGMRIGMALGNRDLIGDLSRVKFSFNPYNLSREAIAAAAAAISDEEYFDLQRGKIMDTRDWFAESLKGLGFTVMPSKTNFVFVKTGAGAFDKIREKNILVRHWDKENIKDWIRVTIGKREDMEKLLAVMEEINENGGN